MAWYDEAVFYHIYPLGLTGAPEKNPYGEPVHRLRELFPWIQHIKEIGCNAIYIGPLFESEGHGYETTDYQKLDGRLGTNEDLKEFVSLAHQNGIRVIFDGVFNHTGRNFFAMQDIRKNRENSPYRDWYQNVNFWGNNEFNDGFSYDNWGGYNIMAKLNQRNPAVRDYICNVIRFWVQEFDVDGIRLDAADVLDFDFMKALRHTANEVKPEFWLMGEVIHGDYTRWVNEGTLHSVTNYHLHKALYSGHNDHNYFEIAHTVKRLYGMGGNKPDGLKLYNFVDNHDVERIYTKLSNKAHFTPVHVLLYTLPGIPSIYYGSEFGIEGKKTYGTDAPLRPHLELENYRNCLTENGYTKLIAALGRIRQSQPALSYGDYQELLLTNRQYAFSRNWNGTSVLVVVNNDDNEASFRLPAGNYGTYVGLLSGRKVSAEGGWIQVSVAGCSGDIYVAEECANWKESETVAIVNQNVEKVLVDDAITEKNNTQTVLDISDEMPHQEEPCKQVFFIEEASHEAAPMETVPVEETIKEGVSVQAAPEEKKSGFVDKSVTEGKAYESMTIEELQEAILSKMEKNGPVTEQMLRSVQENVYPNSLLNWVKSFR
ncbi:MAG: alpha-glucosidase C-terminal domain-containing protein [Lachnospiraceae bacterium]|nr:alpha-glucosidase C-terminal domain-containing protein [Lachnospiraceae bacterium]MBR4606185.1 alpha-glucosidase C-terminal domain-containing protein [Lachnospiraceae bacterium]MBR6151857.1 alpha-glucosidase C-terminal domain-containing protein [Lachnospiraceae bacterium]